MIREIEITRFNTISLIAYLTAATGSGTLDTVVERAYIVAE